MSDTVHYRKDYKISPYQIISTNLTLDLREHETMVTNVMEIERTAKNEEPLVLNGVNQELFTLKLNGEHLARDQYEWTETELIIKNLPKAFQLETVSRIHPESNKSLEGLYKTGGNFCTQCESHGFRKITFYLDRPDVMALFTTKIIADKRRYPVLLSNGNLIETGDLPDYRHFAIWQDPFKKPSYLFALVAGDIEKIQSSFTTQSGREVRLEIYAEKKFISQCDYAMQALKDAMRWDEIRFGREYDLDVYMIYAAPDFNMGAMENKGLNIFNTKFVLTDKTLSTDTDYKMTQAVIGHEYFHNWTGNRVTCRDWFQLSLKEGLTVFRDAEFTADHHDRTIKRIEDATVMRTVQFAEDRGPMAHPIRPDSYVEMNNFYTMTVYEKGAEVIRMMHTLLTETGFRKGMNLYFKRHDGQAVTCDDFVAALADANHYDLTLFKNWYCQAGTPVVKVTAKYDAKTHTYTLHFEQSCPPTPECTDKKPFHIPIRLGLLNKDGQALSFDYNGESHHQTVFSLKERSADLVLKHVDDEPIPSLLRDFSAPVKLEFDYSLEDLKILAKYDSDLFNRWDAKERLLTKILLAAYEGKALNNKDVIEIFSEGLKHALDYPAYSAELLSVPLLKALTECFDVVDPKKLIEVREALLNAIAKSLFDEFTACYKACQEKESENPAGFRALKNLCLAYMGRENQFKLAEAQYQANTNMTDRLAALSVIVNSEDKGLKEKTLEDFYHTYKEYPLVIDKWFAVQASGRASDTLARVEHLMKHPAFNPENPNRVYNSVLAFANNFQAFHREDGKGYRLLREFIEVLDAKNPLVTARLLRSMIGFKSYSEPYRTAMCNELKALQALANLSKDVSEIVNKALQ